MYSPETCFVFEDVGRTDAVFAACGNKAFCYLCILPEGPGKNLLSDCGTRGER